MYLVIIIFWSLSKWGLKKNQSEFGLRAVKENCLLHKINEIIFSSASSSSPCSFLLPRYEMMLFFKKKYLRNYTENQSVVMLVIFLHTVKNKIVNLAASFTHDVSIVSISHWNQDNLKPVLFPPDFNGKSKNASIE